MVREVDCVGAATNGNEMEAGAFWIISNYKSEYIGFSNVLNVIFEFQNRFCSYKYQKINCTFDGFVVSISFQVQLWNILIGSFSISAPI